MSQPPSPPSNLRAEESLTGALIIDPAAYHAVAPLVKPSDFFSHPLGCVFNAIGTLTVQGKQVDPVTICDELERHALLTAVGGMIRVVELMNGCPSALHAAEYARVIADHAARRRALAAAGEIGKAAYRTHEPIDALRAVMEHELTAVFDGRGGGTATASCDLSEQIWQRMAFYMEHPLQPGESRYLDTGWGSLNRRLGGWRPGFYSIIAVPSCGKTWFCLATAVHAAETGKRVDYISLEMMACQIGERICLSYAHLDPDEYERGELGDKAVAFQERLAQMTEWRLMIQDRLSTIDEIASHMRREHMREPLDLVVVDSLNLLQGGDVGNRNLEIGQYTRRLGGLARELGVPILTPHHVSSKAIAARRDKRPRASDAYESGHLEQDVDGLIALHRPEMYEAETEKRNIMEIIVLKDRLGNSAGGPPVNLRFDLWGGVHDDVSYDEPPDESYEEPPPWWNKD